MQEFRALFQLSVATYPKFCSLSGLSRDRLSVLHPASSGRVQWGRRICFRDSLTWLAAWCWLLAWSSAGLLAWPQFSFTWVAWASHSLWADRLFTWCLSPPEGKSRSCQAFSSLRPGTGSVISVAFCCLKDRPTPTGKALHKAMNTRRQGSSGTTKQCSTDRICCCCSSYRPACGFAVFGSS